MAYLDEAIRRRDPQVPLFARAWQMVRFLRAVPGFEERIARVELPSAKASP